MEERDLYELIVGNMRSDVYSVLTLNLYNRLLSEEGIDLRYHTYSTAHHYVTGAVPLGANPDLKLSYINK